MEGRGNAKKVKEITVYAFPLREYDHCADMKIRDTTTDSHMLLTKVRN